MDKLVKLAQKTGQVFLSVCTITAAIPLVSYAGYVCAIEGQTAVLSSSTSQTLNDENKYSSDMTKFIVGTGDPEKVELFVDEMDGEHIHKNDLGSYGIQQKVDCPMNISKKTKCLSYGGGSKDYMTWLYTSMEKDGSPAFRSICTSSRIFACYNNEFSDSDGYVDLDEEFYGADVEYSILFEGISGVANNVKSELNSYLNVALDVSSQANDIEFNVTNSADFKLFPDSYKDIVYLSDKDYVKMCPWYQKYRWSKGKSGKWLGTDEEAVALYAQYKDSQFLKAKYVNEIWHSITGTNHKFLVRDITSKYFDSKNDNYKMRNGPNKIKFADYNNNITGNLPDLLDSTEIPTKAYNKLIKDSYSTNSGREKKYSYRVGTIETDAVMASNWEVSENPTTGWKTIATAVKGTTECSYDSLSDTLQIRNNFYNLQDILPNHGNIIYVRRIASCGNRLWNGSITSPTLKIRPYIALSKLEVFTDKEVVEGTFLDPKDITVIAHYGSDKEIMSGLGPYIQYPGETNLKITIVGTNYVHYIYTDPRTGDIIKGYFQVQGIRKSPVSVTAEYVGDPVVEKKDYELSGLRVNVTFNNGTVDTFTGTSANIGTYKIKTYGVGDMDANKVLNQSDLTTLHSIVEGAVSSEDQKNQSDVNKDGKIDIDDVTALENIISRQVTEIGINTFYAAYSGLNLNDGTPMYARFTVPGIKKSPYSVSVVQDPAKLRYIEGEDFEPKGMILKVLYDNGDYVFFSYDENNTYYAGVQLGDAETPSRTMRGKTVTLPIYYTENNVTVKTDLPLRVSLMTLTSLKVTRAPDLMVYYSGENFKEAGMEVTAYFDENVDGHEPDEILLTSSEYLMRNHKKMKDSTMNVVFELDNPASVTNASGNYLMVAKKLLADGQNFDEFTHGTFSYKDGKTFEGTVCGNYLIKISYTDRGITKYAYQPIWVYNKRPTNLSIVSMPYVTEYIAGQNFDDDGLILRVSYSDGSSLFLYPKTDTQNGYIIKNGTNLTADTTSIIAEYTENITTLQTEIPITVTDPTIDGIEANYMGPTVYVGTQIKPQDVQIIVSYNDGNVKTFRADEKNSDGVRKAKIVIPEADGHVNMEAAENCTVLKKGVNDFAACYAGFYDIFQVNAIENPTQMDFSNSIAKSKRMYDTWTENFTATKIRSVADYIKGRVSLNVDTVTMDEYHVVNKQNPLDNRISLTYESGTAQGLGADTNALVSPLLSFLREGTWRQPETVISIEYKGRTNGFLYPETNNPKFAQKHELDLRYIDEHQQEYNTPREELQKYMDEGWSDWVTNGDTVGTVLAPRVAYNYTGSGTNANSEIMVLNQLKMRLSNVEAGDTPSLNVTIRDDAGTETSFQNITEDDTIENPSQIKIELGGTINVVDNYGVTVSKPFDEVYKVYYRATTDDAASWSTGGEWAGYPGIKMESLEIRLMLQETEFNTGTHSNAPVITKQPKNTVVRIGSNATFSVLVVGNDLRYQWFCNGVEIPGANEAIYTTPALNLLDDGNVYYCLISTEQGQGLETKSSSVSVKVQDNSPVLKKDLDEKYNGRVGDNATFSIEAYCLDQTQLKYEWQITKNGSYVPLAGGNGNTLNINITSDMHGEYIRCKVTNTQGACHSNPCLINCIGSPIVKIVSSEPSNYILNSKANTIRFTATTLSDAPGTKKYVWTFDGVTKTSAKTESTTWIPDSVGSHSITCSVTDSLGATGMATYTIYVGEKPTVQVTSKATKDAAGNITITANATVVSYDQVNLKFRWSYDGGSILNNDQITISEDRKQITIKNAVAGNHSIGLTVTDNFGTASTISAVVAN